LQSVRWNRHGSGRSRQCARRAKICRGEDAADAHVNVIRCSTAGKSIPGKHKRLRRINRLGSGEVADMRRIGLSQTSREVHRRCLIRGTGYVEGIRSGRERRIKRRKIGLAATKVTLLRVKRVVLEI